MGFLVVVAVVCWATWVAIQIHKTDFVEAELMARRALDWVLRNFRRKVADRLLRWEQDNMDYLWTIEQSMGMHQPADDPDWLRDRWLEENRWDQL